MLTLTIPGGPPDINRRCRPEASQVEGLHRDFVVDGAVHPPRDLVFDQTDVVSVDLQRWRGRLDPARNVATADRDANAVLVCQAIILFGTALATADATVFFEQPSFFFQRSLS